MQLNASYGHYAFTCMYRLVVRMMKFNSLMVCDVHVLAGPTPTTFSAATDTLSYFEGGFEGGSKVWLHLPAVHAAMFTLPVIPLIWYCVMFPLTS